MGVYSFESVSVTPVLELEAETAAALAARTTPASQAETIRLNNLIKALKSASLWTLISYLAIGASETAQAARINIKTPSQIGTMTGTEGTDWVFTPNAGYSFLTSSGRMNTGVAWNTLVTQNDALLGIWSADGVQQAGSIAGNVANTNLRATMRNTSDQVGWRINATSGVLASVTVSNIAGLLVGQRTNSSTVQYFYNGAQLGTDVTSTSTAAPTDNLILGASGASLDLRPVNVVVASSQMNATQQLALYNALYAYINATSVGGVAVWGLPTALSSPNNVTLPDIPGYTVTPGKAFTCTGLAYLGSNQFLVGDDGRYGTQAGSYDGTNWRPKVHIVNTSGGLVSSVDIYAIDGSPTTLQGVCVNSDGNYAVARSTRNKLMIVTPGGSLVSDFTVTLSGGINGLAWDSLRNRYYAAGLNDKNTISIINTSGSITGTITLPASAGFLDDLIDQLYYDDVHDALMISKGINGSAGFVYRYKLDTGLPLDSFQLSSTLAMEGCAIVGSSIWVADDEYFHVVGSNLNQLQQYTL